MLSIFFLADNDLISVRRFDYAFSPCTTPVRSQHRRRYCCCFFTIIIITMIYGRNRGRFTTVRTRFFSLRSRRELVKNGALLSNGGRAGAPERAAK